MDMNANQVETENWYDPCRYGNDYIKEGAEYFRVKAEYMLLFRFKVTFYFR
jgi:hypothetical protein